MIGYIDYLKSENKKCSDSYKKHVENIRKIYELTAENDTNIYKYYNQISKLLIDVDNINNKVSRKYFYDNSFEQLKKENEILYKGLLPENYKDGFGDPAYTAGIFGKNYGQILSHLYVKFYNCIDYAYRHQTFILNCYFKFFNDMFELLKNNSLNEKSLHSLYNDFVSDDTFLYYQEFIACKELMTTEYDCYTDIVMNSDMNDLRYLFMYGKHITDNEIKTAELLNTYSQKKIDEIAKYTADCYIISFKRDCKEDYRNKKTVEMLYPIGQERVIKSMFTYLKDYGLKAYILEPDTTDINKQAGYDHKFDNALYFDDDYSHKKIDIRKSLYRSHKIESSEDSGIIVFESFGQKPFEPLYKKEALKLSEQQLKINKDYKRKITSLDDEYLPEKERSFCIISFPVPEIGSKFAEIYDETIRINMLDSNKYEKIQQNIIDQLDKAEYVHVKGKGNNKTDIKIKMHNITDKEKQSNFANCTADCNIPVGEVYTSPMLKGTDGCINVDKVYINGLRYNNLEIRFKDGMISDYNCSNFNNEDENKKYIFENLLYPYDTMPMGEFAIGTNTQAYVFSKKYNIMNILPILIIEKMGPHFAIGDTCFSFAEDIPYYNSLNGKEIIARDNEVSIKRKTDIDNAYTGKHIDITIPYESIEYISAVMKDGSVIDIMKDGLFAVDGAEELNIPLKSLNK